MRYIRGRRAVTSAPFKEHEDKWPQCSFCGKRQMSMNYTEDKRLVCFTCMNNDEEFEWAKSSE